jgi:uncharacterized protein (DUF736 family)
METKNNTGVLFTNDQKGNEKAPNYKGKVNVNGKDMEVAGWIKEGKNGAYISLSFKEPFVKGTTTVKQSNDGMPF